MDRCKAMMLMLGPSYAMVGGAMNQNPMARSLSAWNSVGWRFVHVVVDALSLRNASP